MGRGRHGHQELALTWFLCGQKVPFFFFAITWTKLSDLASWPSVSLVSEWELRVGLFPGPETWEGEGSTGRAVSLLSGLCPAHQTCFAPFRDLLAFYHLPSQARFITAITTSDMGENRRDNKEPITSSRSDSRKPHILPLLLFWGRFLDNFSLHLHMFDDMFLKHKGFFFSRGLSLSTY